jgi:hypothetical protein
MKELHGKMLMLKYRWLSSSEGDFGNENELVLFMEMSPRVMWTPTLADRATEFITTLPVLSQRLCIHNKGQLVP